MNFPYDKVVSQSLQDCETRKEPFVVEYSGIQRCLHVALLADSIVTNLRRFMDGTSGDWEPVALCRDHRTATQVADRLREMFPKRFAPVPHKEVKADWRVTK